MSALLPQDLPPNENRAPQLYAAFWASLPILTAFIAARFWVRIRMRSLGVDDYLMLSGFILYIICNAFGTAYVHAGGAKHLYYIQPVDQLIKVLRYAAIAQPFGVVASALCKASIAGTTLRIASPYTVWQKWFLYACLFILFGTTIADIALKFAQCSPSRAIWDLTILPSDKHCWDPRVSTNMSLANGAWNTFMDFALALIPISIIWNLNLNMKAKISLTGFLGVGVFAGIASAVKTKQLNLIANRADFTWGVYDMYIWTCVEFSLVIICGCIPTIKPIFDFFYHNKPITPSGSGWSKPSAHSGNGHSASGRSAMKETSTFKSMTSTIKSSLTTASDEELVKNGQIMVSRQYDVENQSLPSRSSLGSPQKPGFV